MSDKRPFDDRKEQMEQIKGKLDVLQRRYAGLDVAYQYKDWVLDTLARNPPVIDYEYAFMQWLERNQRWANEAKGKLSLDEALAYAPKLKTGFKRLVAAFRQDNYISLETIQVYADEFADLTEEEFSEMCQRAIRSLDRFPTVAALIRLRMDAKDDAATARAAEERRQEYEEQRRMNIRTALIEERIKALPEEERQELEREALESVGGDNVITAPLRSMLAKKRILTVYEQKYGEVGAE